MSGVKLNFILPISFSEVIYWLEQKLEVILKILNLVNFLWGFL